MKTSIYIIIIFLFISCSKNDNNVKKFQKFPFIISPKSEIIPIPQVINFTYEMFLTDSLLIVKEYGDRFKHTDYFFKIFKLPNFQFYKKMIRQGNGPNETMHLNMLCKLSGDYNFLYSKTVYLQHLEIDLQKGKAINTKKISTPGEFMNIELLNALNDSLLIGRFMHINKMPDSEFILFNTETKEIADFGPPFPTTKYDIPITKLKFLNVNKLTIHPDRNKIAATYIYLPRLRIYNPDGSLHQDILYDNNQKFPISFTKKNSSSKDNREKNIYYWSPKSTKKFIYAMYIGNSQYNYMKSGYKDYFPSKVIHVWDWDGNPVKKIILDTNIICFDVSSDDSYIIAYNPETPDCFYKYKLK